MLMPRGAGVVDRRPKVLIQGAGMVFLGIAVAYLLATGEIRVLTLLLLVVLGLLCLPPRRGTYILLAFLPFMYFLRRQVLYFDKFAARDPILLFPPLVTVTIVFGVVVFYGDRLSYFLARSALLKAVAALLFLFVLQVLNPLQGSVLVGLAGGLFFVIPTVWVFMGLLLDQRDIRKIFGLILAIGTVTALYGIYQHYIGFTEVELYELESKGFLKEFGERPRSMSTFAGLSDFSLYMATTGTLCFAYYWNARRNFLYLALLGLNLFALLWTASRTSILILAFSIITFLIVSSKQPRQVFVRGLVALLFVGGFYLYLYSYTPVEIYRAHGSTDPFIAHTIAGVAHPTEESSFKKRLSTYSYIVGEGFLEYPFGRGLGSTTTAAERFVGGQIFTVDSYFFEIIHGSSIVAGILFIVIVVLFFRASLKLALRHRDVLAYRVVTGLLAGFFLGSVFGYSIRDTIGGPLAWLLIGWMVRESVESSGEAPAADPDMARIA